MNKFECVSIQIPLLNAFRTPLKLISFNILNASLH